MKDDFIMSPKVDFAFKEIMYNETVRKGFLSAVLSIRDTEIKSVVMLNTNLTKAHKDEKQGILDVRLTMNDNTEIDIEMQVCSMKTWAERSVFYVSKMIAEQTNVYHISEDKEHFKYTDIAEWHVVELPKLPEVSDGTDIYDWAKFIKSEKREDFEMLAKKNNYLKEAYNQLDIISQDEQKRLEYTARQKALYDYNELVYENFTTGYEKGVSEGIVRGKAEGLSEGILKEKIRMAKELLKMKTMSLESIAQCTGLSVDEIKSFVIIKKSPSFDFEGIFCNNLQIFI